MNDMFTKVSQSENIDLLAPLLGLGVGIGIGLCVALFLSIWYFILGRQRREEHVPAYYYNRHSTIQVNELRKQLERNKNKSA